MPEALYTQVDLLELFRDIERAIQKNGKFKVLQDPEFKMTRLGCSFVVKVKLVGSKKRLSEISGSGESPWEAAEDLIKGLDHWAIACR